MNSQAIGAELVRRLNAPVLGVLAVERLPGLRRSDFVSVVVALGLAGADHTGTVKMGVVLFAATGLGRPWRNPAAKWRGKSQRLCIVASACSFGLDLNSGDQYLIHARFFRRNSSRPANRPVLSGVKLPNIITDSMVHRSTPVNHPLRYYSPTTLTRPQALKRRKAGLMSSPNGFYDLHTPAVRIRKWRAFEVAAATGAASE